jgi:hypothetical protein
MRNAAIILALGAAAACSGKKESAPPPAPDRVSPHGQEIDSAHAPELAMYKAPEGATPCESAHNAFAAEGDAARKLGRESLFAFLADREAFLAACNALGSEVQKCLVPRYAARNREGCLTALPPNAKLANLFVLREDSQPAMKEPPLPTPKP